MLTPRHRANRLGAVVITAAVLSGCGSYDMRSVTTKPVGTVPTSQSSAPSSTTARAITTAGTQVVTVTEKDNGATINLHASERLNVVLASTYWNVHPSSDPTVLRSDGPPTITSLTSGCVPGQGCGTITATFTAAHSGTATVNATRTTCGEAMRCVGASGIYHVTLRVT